MLGGLDAKIERLTRIDPLLSWNIHLSGETIRVGPLRGRCQDMISYARDLVGRIAVRENGDTCQGIRWV